MSKPLRVVLPEQGSDELRAVIRLAQESPETVFRCRGIQGWSFANGGMRRTCCGLPLSADGKCEAWR